MRTWGSCTFQPILHYTIPLCSYFVERWIVISLYNKMWFKKENNVGFFFSECWSHTTTKDVCVCVHMFLRLWKCGDNRCESFLYTAEERIMACEHIALVPLMRSHILLPSGFLHRVGYCMMKESEMCHMSNRPLYKPQNFYRVILNWHH